MATMLSTRNALFRFSKSFPTVPSLPLPKPSRVFFASASNHSDWRNAAEGPRSTSAGWAYDSPSSKTRRDSNNRAKDTASEGVDSEDIKQYARDTKKAAENAGEKVVDYAYEAKDRTKEAAESGGEKVRDYANDAKSAAESAGGKAVDYAYEAKDAAQSAGEKAIDGIERSADSTAKKTGEAAGATTEALKNAGEKVKETAQGAWDTAKDAGEKIKETVVGKDDA